LHLITLDDTHTQTFTRDKHQCLVGFIPEIAAIKWPQTHTVDCGCYYQQSSWEDARCP